MTDDLVKFLRARLDETAAKATAAARNGGARWHAESDRYDGYAVADENNEPVAYNEGSPTIGQAAHIAEHDPARVLVEVDAKRRIIDLFEAAHERHLNEAERLSPSAMRRRAGRREALDDALCILALPYRDHPDYRPEWAPEA